MSSTPTDSRFSSPDQPTVMDGQAAVGDGTQTFAPGQRLGPYRIERVLGEGGMGAVYLAEQIEPIQRTVALKLIRNQLLGGLAEAYFLVERQALARMDHPAIAKIYDAGTTPQGFPFFAMEWIGGPTLATYCAQHALSLRDTLELFVRICKGVQHAHQKGVIHRDLKPSNVLIANVDGVPMPKIIDFGIAVGATQNTGGDMPLLQRAGTRGYMSPEQSLGKSGEIDIRSDVYALGVMLLELLAPQQALDDAAARGLGNRDLHAALLASLGQKITADDSVARDLAPIPVQLRWALARAIDPERTHRYDSAQALAEDLDRYLRHYPLAAVPATRTYRLRAFATRNRGPILASALIALALLAGTVAAITAMLHARTAAQRAQIEAEKSRQTSAFLTDVLSGVDPEVAKGMDKSLLHLILDNAAKSARQKLASQPEVLATVESTIGVSYRSLSEYKKELSFLQQAHALAAKSLGTDAELTLKLQRQLAHAQSDNGDYAGALSTIGENVQAWTRLRGSDDSNTLISALDLAQYHYAAGNAALALQQTSVLLPRMQRVLGSDNPSTIDAQNVRAMLLGETGKYAQSEQAFLEVLAHERQLFSDESPKILDTMNDFAIMYLESQRYAQGEKILKQLLVLDKRIYGADSAMTNNVVGNLAGALRQQGTPEKIAESGPYYKHALDYASKHYGADHPNTIVAESNYANYLADVGDLDQSTQLQQRALTSADKQPGGLPTITGEIHYQLGRVLLKTGHFADAEPHLLAAAAEKSRELGATHWRMAEYYQALVDLYTHLGKPAEVAQWKSRLATLAVKPPNAA